MTAGKVKMGDILTIAALGISNGNWAPNTKRKKIKLKFTPKSFFSILNFPLNHS